jgi:hypothetical protein
MMKTFVRITAITLIALGLLIVLGGVIAAFAGAIGGGGHHFPAPDGPMPFPHPMDGKDGRHGLGLLLAAALFVQGLIVTAIGQGLYLLNSIGEKTAGPAPAPARPAPRKVAAK